MLGHTWKNVENSMAEKIKRYLLEQGGQEEGVGSIHEEWRVRFSDSTFTYYKKGTLYSTPSKSNDPAVLKAWRHVDSLVSSYVPSTKDYLIGLDETGKGEVVGHMVLTGVVFPKEIFGKINLLVGPADTKKRHEFGYWDDIFKKIDQLRVEGLDFINEKVPPWQIDKYNLNKIMDVTYQRILNIFFRKTRINQCRVVVDDYGMGSTLEHFLDFLKKQGAEVIVAHNADEKYLEAKTASLISKRTREAVIKAINEDPEFRIDGLSVGSGNAGDPQTIKWLEKRHASGKPWPWFVKRSFRTVREIEGKIKEPEKVAPPIREDLLSEEFLGEFNKGRLSIQSLSLICPSCGAILKSATFATFDGGKHKISELRCPSCNNFIKNAGFTLRYYCGYVVPDSSVIQRNLISNDLAASKFFEDFTVILASVVRKECDGTPRGKREFGELWKYNAMGRIRLESLGKIEEIPDDLPKNVRDEKIIETCLDCNAILLTADASMSAFSGGKNVFTIFI
jgi:ribonuclease HII